MIAVTQLNTDEVLRYMGCPPDRADGALREQVEDCAGEPVSYTHLTLPTILLV